MNITRVNVLPIVILRLKKATEFLRGQIKLHPLLVEGLFEAMNTRLMKSLADSRYGVVIRSKESEDLS